MSISFALLLLGSLHPMKSICQHSIPACAGEKTCQSAAQSDKTDQDRPIVEKSERTGFSLFRTRRGVFSPGTFLYPPTIASPTRPMMEVTRLNASESAIPGAGRSRYLFRLGGRWGFLRIFSGGQPDRGLQIDLEGAFLGMFDVDNSLDNIGWDGLYGALITWANGEGWAIKLGTRHDSSHVGDEYAERTGRSRINYTREEWVLGVSWQPIKTWRVFAEAGSAFDMRNEDLQKRWRGEAGLEFEDAHRWLNRQAGLFAAVDVTAYEETDWETDICIQAGFVRHVPDLSRTYRLGITYRDGRTPMGEFLQSRETYLGLGVWMDL